MIEFEVINFCFGDMVDIVRGEYGEVDGGSI